MNIQAFTNGYMYKQANPLVTIAAKNLRRAAPVKDILKGVPRSVPAGTPREAAKRARMGAKMNIWHPEGKMPRSLWDRLKALDPGGKASQAAQEARDYAVYQRDRLMSGGGYPHTTPAEVAAGRAAAIAREEQRARNLQLLANTQRTAAGGAAGSAAVAVTRPDNPPLKAGR